MLALGEDQEDRHSRAGGPVRRFVPFELGDPGNFGGLEVSELVGIVRPSRTRIPRGAEEHELGVDDIDDEPARPRARWRVRLVRRCGIERIGWWTVRARPLGLGTHRSLSERKEKERDR